ncbi:MAG: hypothetical protein ABIA63_14755 [bacterium]
MTILYPGETFSVIQFFGISLGDLIKSTSDSLNALAGLKSKDRKKRDEIFYILSDPIR